MLAFAKVNSTIAKLPAGWALGVSPTPLSARPRGGRKAQGTHSSNNGMRDLIARMDRHGDDPVNDESPLTPEAVALRHLWQAVIMQVIMDAIHVTTATAKNVADVQDEAIRWLTKNNKDFQMVADMAGLRKEFIERFGMEEALRLVGITIDEWKAGKRPTNHGRKV